MAKMSNKWPGFAPHYDHDGASKGSEMKGKKASDGDLKSKDHSDHESDEGEYGRGEGFTGSKVSIHQHEDGSYHTHAVHEDGEEEKKEHPSFEHATKYAAKHFGEHEMDHDGDEDDDAGEEKVSSHKGGLGNSIASMMA